MMGYREGKGKCDSLQKNDKHKRGTLYEVIIYEISVSLKVQRSYDDKYVLFKHIKLNNSLIKKMEKLQRTL